ncbi:MAG: dTDP-4-dehydrorhamnose reductase [Muribaculaceae bacterium]|nr:dTDP-4-dehydrorhamnose reductase [Muribaculaceae bacterium]
MNDVKQILITGANGQLGKELLDLFSQHPNMEVLPTDVDTLDITSDAAVNAFFNAHHIDCVVNCAAFTAVDGAESQQDLCRLINVDGPRVLATAARDHGARMIHISTDYVYNGDACTPYQEDALTDPQSVYGVTKLEGERQVLDTLGENAIILRTAWLYSPHGKNFVKTMLDLGHTRQQLTVVFDQIGSPTYARDLASAIITITETQEWKHGIYHYSNEGAISWYDFTKAIHRIAGITGCRVLPCRSADYPTPAHRPSYSVLDKTKIKKTYNIEIPYWEDSLHHCIKRIMNKH